MRTAARKDDNHNEVIKAFNSLGWSDLDISQLKNCCDAFISKSGVTVAIEIKDGSKPPSQRKLTPGEVKFKNRWKGKYEIIQSIDDVLTLNKRLFP